MNAQNMNKINYFGHVTYIIFVTFLSIFVNQICETFWSWTSIANIKFNTKILIRTFQFKKEMYQLIIPAENDQIPLFILPPGLWEAVNKIPPSALRLRMKL